MKSSTSTDPYSHTRPRSLRPRSTSITCSARSLGSASSSSRDPVVVLGARAAGTGARDRAGGDMASADGDQRLGARAGDLEVAEVQEVHVRARIDRAQAPIDRERLDRHRRRPPLRGDDLVGVAGMDVADDPRDHRPRTAPVACSARSWASPCRRPVAGTVAEPGRRAASAPRRSSRAPAGRTRRCPPRRTRSRAL